MLHKQAQSLLEKAKSGSSPLAHTPAKTQPLQMEQALQSVANPIEQLAVGKAFTSSEEKFPLAELHLAQAPPPEVAILHIYTDGTDAYMIWGGHIDGGLEFAGPHRRPDLSLGEMVQRYRQEELELPHSIKQYMQEFSRPHFKLRQWLNGLRQGHGENLNLLILDHTDFEIPWEMFKLSQGPDYLGAKITTVRWQHIVTWDVGTLLLKFEPEECQGHVVSFVDQAELEGVGPELEALGELNAWNAKDIKAFQKRLIEKVAGVGLVYVASHGIWGRHVSDMALGSLRDEKQRIRLMELYELELTLFKYSRSVVFINACHSGRLRSEEHRLRDSLRRGFVELFLNQGARGVIGTLSSVNDVKAAYLAQEFMTTVQLHPDLSVATILRLLRARAVATLPEEPGDEELLSFVNTFLYVYYGSPLTRLRLLKRIEENDAG